MKDEERKSNMKTSYPLPLELTKPVAMATDLDTALTANLENSKYNPETQVRMWKKGGGGHNSNSTCFNGGCIQVDDILNDNNF